MKDDPLSFQIRRVSLGDAVYENLLQRIVMGKIPRGGELVAGALATQIGVSRTPVVEAIRRLTIDGLVEQTTNRTARVARFNEKDIREIYELRCVLEPTAAAKAASRISDEKVAAIRSEAQKVLASVGESDWTERALEFDIRFHDEVARLSGNSRLARDINRYRLLVRGFCRMSGSQGNLENAFREHLEILDAMARRDPEAAALAMKRHIQARAEALLRQVSAQTERQDASAAL